MLLSDVKAALRQDAREKLQGLAQASVVLECMLSSESRLQADDITTAMGARFIGLTQQLFILQNEVEELSSLKHRFDQEQKDTEEEVAKPREDAVAVEDDKLQPQALEPS